MKNPTDRRVIRTKNRIYESFISLLEEREYETITVTALSARADINRKTFYEYYNGIDDLLNKTEDRIFEHYIPLFRTIDLNSEQFDIIHFAEQYNNILSSDIHILRILADIDDLRQLSSKTKAFLVSVIQPQLSSQDIDMDQLHLFLEYALSGMLAMITEWIKEPTRSLEEFTSFLIKITQGAFLSLRKS